MRIQTARFIASADSPESCPRTDLAEFAFIGRSNVGKSSLINMLTGKTDLALVSATPGKTRRLNFFLINEQWRLVDLPGYGYAKVGNKEHAEFLESVAGYIATRENLKCVFVLIDSGIAPMRIDLEFLQWLQGHPIEHVLVFTKTDKPTASALSQHISLFKETVSDWELQMPAQVKCSAKTGKGRLEILQQVAQRLPKPGSGKRRREAPKAGKAAFDWVRKMERKHGRD